MLERVGIEHPNAWALDLRTHGHWTLECVGIGPSNAWALDPQTHTQVTRVSPSKCTMHPACACASGTSSRVHIEGAPSVAHHGPERGSMSEFSRNMKYCCTYLICLRSCAGVDVGECLRQVWVVQRLQSDLGRGARRTKNPPRQ